MTDGLVCISAPHVLTDSEPLLSGATRSPPPRLLEGESCCGCRRPVAEGSPLRGNRPAVGLPLSADHGDFAKSGSDAYSSSKGSRSETSRNERRNSLSFDLAVANLDTGCSRGEEERKKGKSGAQCQSKNKGLPKLA